MWSIQPSWSKNTSNVYIQSWLKGVNIKVVNYYISIPISANDESWTCDLSTPTGNGINSWNCHDFSCMGSNTYTVSATSNYTSQKMFNTYIGIPDFIAIFSGKQKICKQEIQVAVVDSQGIWQCSISIDVHLIMWQTGKLPSGCWYIVDKTYLHRGHGWGPGRHRNVDRPVLMSRCWLGKLLAQMCGFHWNQGL